MKKILFTALMGLSLISCCPEKKGFGDNFGIQLYSLRTLIGKPELYAENHEAVLKTIADMGYKSVEAASYQGEEGTIYGVSPEQFRSDVEAAGMKVLSAHVKHVLTEEELAAKDFTPELEWWAKCIAVHKTAGCKYLVMPSMPKHLEKLEDLQVYCDYYNAVGKMCKEAGLDFGYHSHSFEFVKIEDQMMYDYMIEHTDPELVFFQMDVYWAVYGRVSPVEYFKKYPGRFKCLHIKDYREVGQSGMVGFDAIFKNVALAGAEDFVVEMEKSGVDDIIETCRISINYLTGKE